MNWCARPGWPRRALSAAAATLALAGCAAGPEFIRPPSPDVDRYTPQPLPAATAGSDVPGSAPQRFQPGTDVPAQWWKLFGSRSLDALVMAALETNPSLQAAQAALRVAQETVRIQQGAFWPSAQAVITPSRQKVADVIASPLASNETVFNLHTAQLTIGFVPDVFGANRRQVESLEAQAEAQRFLRDAAYVALTANVVVAAIQEASLRGQIAATRESIRIAAEQLELARRQLKLGAIAAAGVVAQESALAQIRTALPPLQKQLALQRAALTALAGRLPQDEIGERFELADLQLPIEVPLSLPSRLVEHRPDVRAAEAQLHAASAQIGVAAANLLPQFNLTASTGNIATSFSQLFSAGNMFWNVAAGAMQPIFQGGALRAKKRAAEAAYEQVAAQYRSTVVSAFQDVANTLAALDADAEALGAAVDAERAATQSLALAQRQQQLGDISYLALLAAEQTYHQAIIGRVQSQASRLSDTVALFQALGGDAQ